MDVGVQVTTTTEPATATKKTCPGITDGRPCRAHPTKSGYCVFHDKSIQAPAAIRGGKHSSLKHRCYKRLPEPLAGLLIMAATAAEQVRDGSLSPAQGSSIASLVSCVVRALEVADYAVRLERLEEATAKHVSGDRSDSHGAIFRAGSAGPSNGGSLPNN